VSRYLRPVFSQHALTEGIHLHLADGGHAGALQAQFEAADAREQAEDVEAHDVTFVLRYVRTIARLAVSPVDASHLLETGRR